MSLATLVLTFVSDMYTPVLGQSPMIDMLFLRLRKKIAAEMRFQRILKKTKSAVDMLLLSSALTATQE